MELLGVLGLSLVILAICYVWRDDREG